MHDCVTCWRYVQREQEKAQVSADIAQSRQTIMYFYRRYGKNIDMFGDFELCLDVNILLLNEPIIVMYIKLTLSTNSSLVFVHSLEFPIS
jgi:hypothetical protein